MLWGFGPDSWNAIFGAVNAAAVTVGIIFAIYNLRYIRRQQYFEAFASFIDDLEANASCRSRIYHDFPITDDYSKVDKELISAAVSVINFLNTTATLIERDMLPRTVVLSLMHTVIVRCWYKLEAYSDYVERVSQGRYARKVRQLDVLAKAFHDSRPHQRRHAICLFADGKSLVIHETTTANGLGRLFQQVLRTVRFRTGLFFPNLRAA